MSGVKICAFCGKNFESRVAHSKFCSKSCQGRFFRTKQRDEYWEKKVAQSPKEIVSAVCPHCGKTFRKSKTSTRRFCTSECNELHQCGIPFRPPPKSYAEIKAANRAAKVESGWRGRKVSGGGTIKNRQGLMVADC